MITLVEGGLTPRRQYDDLVRMPLPQSRRVRRNAAAEVVPTSPLNDVARDSLALWFCLSLRGHGDSDLLAVCASCVPPQCAQIVDSPVVCPLYGDSRVVVETRANELIGEVIDYLDKLAF